MTDDNFNMSMRKFLKRVGVTSQQQIEGAVREAREAGKLPSGTLHAEVVLKVDGLGLAHRIEGEISLPDKSQES